METSATFYGRCYEREDEFDLTTAKLFADSWLYVALIELKSRSHQQRLNSGNVRLLFALASECCISPGVRRFLALPISSVGRYEVALCFRAVEDLLRSRLAATWGPTTLIRSSSHFRKVVVEDVPSEYFAEHVSKHRTYFRTSLNVHRVPRKTLSESVKEIGPEYLQAPLGATPHSTIEQLREREVERMTADIERLRQGCRDELRFWRQVRERMTDMEKYRPTKDETKLVGLYLRGGMTNYRMNLLGECSISGIASAIVRYANTRGNPRHPERKSWAKDLVFEPLLDFYQIPVDRTEGLHSKHIYFLSRNIHMRELLAAFLALLIHTRFNGHSLRSVQRNWIKENPDGSFSVDAFKGKTGRFTPTVDITRENQPAYDAIKLLIWNHDQLRKFGHIGPDENRIWFCWNNKNTVMTEPFTNPDQAKRILLTQLKMQWFSNDQIRTHMLTLDKFRSGREFETIRQDAGHQSLNTTAHYFDQLSTQLHSSAINLEYKRRLDATIKFAISDDREFFAKKFDPRFVDKNLLFPIGDGTSCSSPYSPPDPGWLFDGVCDAKRCHAGDGCPNNRIIVGKARVREIWATSEYYANNWHRLLVANEQAFMAWHGPAMIFNLALKSYIRSSTFWPMIRPLVNDDDSETEE